MAWLLPFLVIILLGGGAMAYRQQDGARRTAEARAAMAEAQLVAVSASLTAVLRAEAIASASAETLANDPGPTVERALRLVFAAYQEPTEAHVRALADAFGPAALAIETPEIEHLISAGTHLGGDSAFTVEVQSQSPSGPTNQAVKTHERWVYDEQDASNRRVRCVIEEGDQTYILKRIATGWQVEEVHLGTTRRTLC